MNDYQFDSVRKFEPNAAATVTPVSGTSAPVDAEIPVSYPMSAVRSRAQQLHALSLNLHQPVDVMAGEGSSRQNAPNQRQYSRCPISEKAESATLNMNGRHFHCRLVELSLVGFGVVTSAQLRLTPGLVGGLRTRGLNYLVKVARQETRPDGTFISLTQIEEVSENQLFPGENASRLGYLIAAVAGALIATISFYFVNGS